MLTDCQRSDWSGSHIKTCAGFHLAWWCSVRIVQSTLYFWNTWMEHCLEAHTDCVTQSLILIYIITHLQLHPTHPHILTHTQSLSQPWHHMNYSTNHTAEQSELCPWLGHAVFTSNVSRSTWLTCVCMKVCVNMCVWKGNLEKHEKQL